MFESIRRHQKWLWIVIMTLTIISFVAFFSPRSQRGYSSGGMFGDDKAVGSINGRDIGREEYLDAVKEARLRYYLSYGQWPRDDEMTRRLGLMERETRNRIVLLEKLKEFDIRVSDTATAEWISEVWRDPTQHKFRYDAYDQFVKIELPQKGLAKGDFERFARHEVGIEHLISVAGLGGKLVTPQEAETLYRRENEQIDTQVAFLRTTNYLSQVQIDAAALAAYYTNHQAEYRVPEKVQVAYVKFEATNYLAEADRKIALETNLTQLLESVYQQRGTNSFRDASNQPLTPDAAKAKIREELRHNQALLEAQRQAIEFANALLELPPQTNNLANLAAAKGILSKVTEPFSRNEQPPGMKVPNTFGQVAFQLSPERPIYDQPLVAEDGVYLIGYNKRIPSEIIPLDSIRDRVTEDFRKSKAAELLQSAGNELFRNLTNGLAQGKTFQALAGGTNISVIDLPPFSKKTAALPEIPNRSDLSALKTAAFSLAPGKVSSFTTTQDGGAIIYAQAKLPVADSQLQKDLPEFMKDLRRSRQYEAFSEWLRKETELARVSLPGDKQSAN
jgi:hypothetical protein